MSAVINPLIQESKAMARNTPVNIDMYTMNENREFHASSCLIGFLWSLD